MKSNENGCKATLSELNELILTLLEAKDRVENGEAVEIMCIGRRPIVMPLSDTIKSGCFEIEIRPDPPSAQLFA